jgi:hypothetical protein
MELRRNIGPRGGPHAIVAARAPRQLAAAAEGAGAAGGAVYKGEGEMMDHRAASASSAAAGGGRAPAPASTARRRAPTQQSMFELLPLDGVIELLDSDDDDVDDS